jgi:hypothetical protein
MTKSYEDFSWLAESLSAENVDAGWIRIRDLVKITGSEKKIRIPNTSYSATLDLLSDLH